MKIFKKINIILDLIIDNLYKNNNINDNNSKINEKKVIENYTDTQKNINNLRKSIRNTKL